MRQQSLFSIFALWSFTLLCVQVYAGQLTKNMPLAPSLSQSEIYPDGHKQAIQDGKPSLLNKVMTRFVQNRIKKQLPKWEKEHGQIDDHCALITKEDGSEISAKIIEITPDEVRYKKCDYLDGPTFSIKKSEISIIKYSNGTTQIFKVRPSTPSPDEQYRPGPNNISWGRRPPHKLAVIAMSSGLAGILITLLGSVVGGIFGIGAIVLGVISLVKIRQNPEQFRGKGMAWIGIAAGSLPILLMIAFILFFLVAIN